MRTSFDEASGGMQLVAGPQREEKLRRKSWNPRVPSLFALLSEMDAAEAPLSSRNGLRTVQAEERRRDEELLQRICSGDRLAMAQLYQRYAKPLRRAALAIMRRREDAEDLISELFCEVLRDARSFDPGRASVRTWLVLRLRSRGMDRLRRQRFRFLSQQRVAEREPDCAASGRPEDRYLSLLVQRAVAGLPERQRQMVELCYFRDLSMEEAAGQLRCPKGTVKSGLHRLLGGLSELSLG